ncbi:MAG: DUF1801 domain-containing protein [Paludibacter sp.]
MQIQVESPDLYVEQLPEDRKMAINRLRQTILENLPPGFVETINYGMIGYVVPHSIYPKGYHCDPALPLPFIGVASQKNFVAIYHMGLYANVELMNWFVAEYPKHCKAKLDMGKSCIRFKNPDNIPYALIGELAKKISPQEWIRIYEETFRSSTKK